MNGFNLTFFVAAFFAIVSGVASLQCYSCSPCVEPFDRRNATIVENCNGSCLKTKTNGAYNYVVRQCSTTNLGDVCERSSGVQVCSCTTDLCNGASSSGITFFGLITVSIVIFFRKI